MTRFRVNDLTQCYLRVTYVPFVQVRPLYFVCDVFMVTFDFNFREHSRGLIFFFWCYSFIFETKSSRTPDIKHLNNNLLETLRNNCVIMCSYRSVRVISRDCNSSICSPINMKGCFCSFVRHLPVGDDHPCFYLMISV